MSNADNRLNSDWESSFLRPSVWLEVLEAGLGAKSVEIVLPGDKYMFVPVFRKGPFRVAYPGFPMGDVQLIENIDWLKAVDETVAATSWDMLRLWQSCLVGQVRTRIQPSSWIPETCITDLQSWDPSGLPSAVKRNVRKARKLDVSIEPAMRADAQTLFELYSSMIVQRKGALRYTLAYFEELVKASLDASHLHVNVARSAKGELLSMLVSLYSQKKAYYLHGAIHATYTHMRPADLLMHDAICHAKSKGMKAFSFLPSPVGQPGLIRFKEKWGGVTLMTPVYDCFRPTARGAALRIVFMARKHMSR